MLSSAESHILDFKIKEYFAYLIHVLNKQTLLVQFVLICDPSHRVR